MTTDRDDTRDSVSFLLSLLADVVADPAAQATLPARIVEWANATPDPTMAIVVLAGSAIAQWSSDLVAWHGQEGAAAHLETMRFFQQVEEVGE